MNINTSALQHKEIHTDFCVIGGGLSGMIAAISAAREGSKVVLMQDRPVLGGNASSEVRMWVRGAYGLHNRETGLISELEQENIYRNGRLNYSVWDSVLLGKVLDEKNITLLTNCSCVDALTENGEIKSVTGWQLTTYTWITVYAKLFADCSGDSILAPLTGALHRIGREGHDEFNETIGPVIADKKTMGMSCLLQAKETDEKVEFIPPEWANVYLSDSDFNLKTGKNISKDADFIKVTSLGGSKKMFRDHELATSGTNFWWMELGGEYDSIHDTEMLRNELLKVAFGVWDHIKNRGDHSAENWSLEWVGFLPGKRESVRYIGEHILTQGDVEAEGCFDDVVAFGGWPMDDHHPGGMHTPTECPASLLHPAPSPYGIPYRVLYSKNIKNLMFAGRNISATHAANSSTRVMATCSLLGQATGTAAAICLRENITPHALYEKGGVAQLQAKLMEAGCYIPWKTREISELTKNAKINLDGERLALLQNGVERPDEKMSENFARLAVGDTLEFDFGDSKDLSELRIMFDMDFSRKSISPNKKMRVFAQKCNEGKDFVPLKVAATMVKSFEVYADGNKIYQTDKNHVALFRLPLNIKAKKLNIHFTQTWGENFVNLYSCEVK